MQEMFVPNVFVILGVFRNAGKRSEQNSDSNSQYAMHTFHTEVHTNLTPNPGLNPTPANSNLFQGRRIPQRRILILPIIADKYRLHLSPLVTRIWL